MSGRCRMVGPCVERDSPVERVLTWKEMDAVAWRASPTPECVSQS
jgi:hypothetical protein